MALATAEQLFPGFAPDHDFVGDLSPEVDGRRLRELVGQWDQVAEIHRDLTGQSFLAEPESKATGTGTREEASLRAAEMSELEIPYPERREYGVMARLRTKAALVMGFSGILGGATSAVQAGTQGRADGAAPKTIPLKCGTIGPKSGPECVVPLLEALGANISFPTYGPKTAELVRTFQERCDINRVVDKNGMPVADPVTIEKLNYRTSTGNPYCPSGYVRGNALPPVSAAPTTPSPTPPPTAAPSPETAPTPAEPPAAAGAPAGVEVSLNTLDFTFGPGEPKQELQGKFDLDKKARTEFKRRVVPLYFEGDVDIQSISTKHGSGCQLDLVGGEGEAKPTGVAVYVPGSSSGKCEFRYVVTGGAGEYNVGGVAAFARAYNAPPPTYKSHAGAKTGNDGGGSPEIDCNDSRLETAVCVGVIAVGVATAATVGAYIAWARWVVFA